MEELKTIINYDVYHKLIEGKVDSIFVILNKSVNELHDLTRLSIELLETIKKEANNIALKQTFCTAEQVPPWDRISTGCSNIDSVLHGGIPINGITEIYGCSGVGKTQFCLQLVLMVQLPKSVGGKEKEAVYICTEDVFPSKRFHQLANTFKNKYNLNHYDFGDKVHLEHAADFEQLRRCLCVRLPQLLNLKNVGLIIVDSIAGVFRSENNDICYSSRGQDIGIIGSALHHICYKYKVGIVCINQVAENFATEKTEPCLGLAWSNNVTCRFCITRNNNSRIRDFEVIFAPDLPNTRCNFVVNENGLRDL
ncbi:DNA repair protein XRCC3 [Anoplophora glabripennis]|uniref:DNA repair protein XRCC3 n=1 Tax=Anoplophora glabripennis TaxID=217634 RepID=UPI0008757C01|nr:DNA repair protein XRCC3 [Anoplophora glabripennis]